MNRDQVDARKLLKKLKGQYKGYCYVERALRLPQGLLTDYEKGKRIPKHIVALVRIILALPWMLEVADNDFKSAKEALVENVLIKPEKEIQEKIINKGW